MPKRPQHKVGHPGCPNENWVNCDLREKQRFGQCKAMHGDREPVPCTRWAVSEDGWCWQHYASEKDRVKREEHIAIAKEELNFTIDAYIAMSVDNPWKWLDHLRSAEESTRGLAGVAGVEPTQTVLETVRPPRLTPTKPFRLTEPA